MTLKAAKKIVPQKVKLEKLKDSYFGVACTLYEMCFRGAAKTIAKTSCWVRPQEWRDNIFKCVQVGTRN